MRAYSNHSALLRWMLLPIMVFHSCAWCKQTDAGLKTPSPAHPELVTQYRYNDDGALEAYVDPVGRKTDYLYEQGLLISARRSDGTRLEYAYDRLGRRVAVKDQSCRTTYRYDSSNRFVRISQDDLLTADFEYYDSGNVETLTVRSPCGDPEDPFRLMYRYDVMDRLTSVSTPIGVITWSYDPGKGTTTRTLPNGIVTVLAYDSKGKLESILHRHEDGRMLAEYRYRHHPNGKLAFKAEKSGLEEPKVTEYDYDPAGRIEQVRVSGKIATRYEFDKFDNRIARIETNSNGGASREDYMYDGFDRLLKGADVAYSHDAAGCMTMRRAGARVMRYAYDATNRLVESVSSAGSVKYTYNGDGILAGRRAGKDHTTYLFSPGSTGPQMLASLRKDQCRYYLLTDRVLGSVSGNSVEFYLEDRLGSLRCVVDREGQVVKRIDYKPFGQPTEPMAEDMIRPAFAGFPYDSTTKLYILGPYTYDPDLGRFMQDIVCRIPSAAPLQQFSRYAYCAGDPVNLVPRWERTPLVSTGSRVPKLPNTPRLPIIATPAATPVIPKTALPKPVAPPTMPKIPIIPTSPTKPASPAISGPATAPKIPPLPKAPTITTGPATIKLPPAATPGAGRLPKIPIIPTSPTKPGSPAISRPATAPEIPPLPKAPTISTGPAAIKLPAATPGLPETSLPKSVTPPTMPKLSTSTPMLANPSGPSLPKTPTISTGPATVKPEMPEYSGRTEPLVSVSPTQSGLIVDARPSVSTPYAAGPTAAGQSITPYRTERTEPSTVRMLFTDSDRQIPAVVTTIQPSVASSPGVLGFVKRLGHILSKYPNIDWENSGHEAFATGRKGEANFYFGLESIAYATARTPVVGPISKNSFTAFVDQSATGWERLKDGAWLGVDMALLAGPSLLNSAGKSYLAGASAYPNSMLAENFRFIGNSLVLGGKTLGIASNASTGYAIGKTGYGIWEQGPLGYSPQNVGGVYLGQAAEAIADLGEICGITLDEATGRIVLISRRFGEDVVLPKIELGDFAVVLRSVFKHHKAPYFSFEIDPKDPEGPHNISLYSPGTENTRVGWILYHADRLMKCYSMGKDNVTRKPVDSQVEGHQKMLLEPLVNNLISGRSWHRYWLEPLPFAVYDTDQGGVAFENPNIYVRIQKMELRGGKLVPAGWIDNDPAAKPFKLWFTRHYDEIAQEEHTILPDPVSKGKTIAVFSELHRLAGLVALAEQLKRKGVRPPHWLLYYPAKEYPTLPTTPAIDVSLSSGNMRRLMHGGVDLAPRITVLAREAQAGRNDRTPFPPLEDIEAALALIAPAQSEPATVDFESDGVLFRTIALPGAKSSAFGAFTQDNTDLTVTTDSGQSLSLVRSYNSFHNEKTPFGTGWQVALPSLDINLVQAKRRANRITYKANAAWILDPLGKQLFDFVPDSAAEGDYIKLISSDPDVRMSLSYQESSSRSVPVYHVQDRQGSFMDFSDDGRMLTQFNRAENRRLEYHWSQKGTQREKLIQMTILTSDGRLTISLDYDDQGRIQRAVSSNKEQVSYEYNALGQLSLVKTSQSTIRYTYDQRGLVNSVREGEQPLLKLRYNHRGQIAKVFDGSKDAVTFTIENMADGRAAILANTPAGWRMDIFDAAMHITRTENSRGNRQTYRWNPDGTLHTLVSENAAGRRTVTSLKTDSASVTVDGREVLKAHTDPQTRSLQLTSADCRVGLRYGKKGRIAVQTIEPHGNTQGQAVSLSFTEIGKLAKIQVGPQEAVEYVYNEEGRLTKIEGARASYTVEWSRYAGLPSAIKGSDGSSCHFRYEKGPPHLLNRMVITQGRAQRSIWFENGAPVEVQDFDQGRTVYTYENAPESSEGANKPRLKSVKDPLGRKTIYEIDTEDRPRRIDYDRKRYIEWRYEGGVIDVIESCDPIEYGVKPTTRRIYAAALN